MAIVMQVVRALFIRFHLVKAGDGDSWGLSYLWFAIAQLVLLFVAMFFALDVRKWEGNSVAVIAGLLALFVVVDIALMVLMGRSLERERQMVWASAAKRRVDDYLAQSARMQSLLDDTARLRHDLRNHRGIVQMLCDRGDYDCAQAYLEDLSDRFAIEEGADSLGGHSE